MTASQSTLPPRRDDEPPTIAGVVDMVTTYTKQETLGPLRGAGKWLAMGTAGAALLGLGLSIITLGLLRMVQTEWDRSAEGSLSWLAYLVALIFSVALLVLTLSRINKDSLDKEPK